MSIVRIVTSRRVQMADGEGVYFLCSDRLLHSQGERGLLLKDRRPQCGDACCEYRAAYLRLRLTFAVTSRTRAGAPSFREAFCAAS